MREDIYIYSCESLYIILEGKFKHALTTCTFDKPFQWKKKKTVSLVVSRITGKSSPATNPAYRLVQSSPMGRFTPALSKNAPLNDCNAP